MHAIPIPPNRLTSQGVRPSPDYDLPAVLGLRSR
jgi:hypothetical protein